MITRKIYLAGKIGGLKFEESNGWRENATKFFNEYWSKTYNIITLNPNDYYNYDEHNHLTNKEIMRFCLRNIEDSDIVLLNLDQVNTSVGTTYEIGKAYDMNKTIVGFNETLDLMYPWTEEMCDIIFMGTNAQETAMQRIVDYYLV